MPEAAGEAAFVAEGFARPALGIAVGLAIVLAGTISAAAVLRGGAGYLLALADLPMWSVILGAGLILTAVGHPWRRRKPCGRGRFHPDRGHRPGAGDLGGVRGGARGRARPCGIGRTLLARDRLRGDAGVFRLHRLRGHRQHGRRGAPNAHDAGGDPAVAGDHHGAVCPDGRGGGARGAAAGAGRQRPAPWRWSGRRAAAWGRPCCRPLPWPRLGTGCWRRSSWPRACCSGWAGARRAGAVPAGASPVSHAGARHVLVGGAVIVVWRCRSRRWPRRPRRSCWSSSCW